MEAKELKTTVERIYKIQMAAVKVVEANEAMLAAEKAREGITYDFTHYDRENNARYFALADEYYKREGLLKKAVNNFFKVVGEPTKKWDIGFSAMLAYNKYIDEHCGWGCKSPVPELNLYQCKARKYNL